MITIDQMNEALADRLEELLPDLIGGRQKGKEWIALSTGEGGIGDSLQVGLRGHKRGKWFHHAAGKGGDPLGLIAHTRTAGDMKAAFRWAREFLGGNVPEDTEKERTLRMQRKAAAERKEKRETRAMVGRARYLFWKKAETDIRGTPAWHYLNQRLGGRLDQLGHLPGCIHFMPKLHNSQLDRELPAMVAAIVNAEGQQIGLHRTWLVLRNGPNGTQYVDRLRESDGIGKDGRALMGKKVLGQMKGGTIRLWAGQSVDGKTGEVRKGVSWSKLGAGASIALAEGIETGLSLALAMPERRIACAVAIEGFADVVLPPCFTKVTIAADRDPNNPAAKAALERAAEAHAAAGRDLKIVFPPEGIDDWNSALNPKQQRVA